MLKIPSKITTGLIWISFFLAIIPPDTVGSRIFNILIGSTAFLFAIRERRKNAIVLASLALILMIGYMVFFVNVMGPGIERRREVEKSRTLLYNLRVVGRSLEAYAKNHENQLPESQNWCDVMMAYDPNLTKANFCHPKDPNIVMAFNSALSKADIRHIPKFTMVLFEAPGRWNLSGGKELLSKFDEKQWFVDSYIWGLGPWESYNIEENKIGYGFSSKSVQWTLP